MKKIIFVILMCCAAYYSSFAQKLEIVARVMPPTPDMSGIAITPDGRIFISFPRHADNHKEYALAELKEDGQIVPFPNREMTYPSDHPYEEWLVSPHGMTTFFTR